VPLHDITAVPIRQILEIIRTAEEHNQITPDRIPTEPAVERVTNEISESVNPSLAGLTIGQLLELDEMTLASNAQADRGESDVRSAGTSDVVEP